MAPRRLLLRLVGPRIFKRWLPTTLYGRSLLIIIIPMGLMQLVISLLLFNAHWETVTGRLTHAVAGDVAWTVGAWKQDHSPAAFEKLQSLAEKTQGLSVTFKPQPLPASDRTNIFASLDRTLRSALEDELDDRFWFDTTRYPNYVDIRVKVDGGSLIFIAPRDQVFAPRAWIFILLLPGSSLFLALISVLFIRNQIRAIERLADAANTFGRGGDVSDFKPHGAREVRDAATAFITMKDNIQRHLEQRTALLASVSHDLRTPLTRLNLELALAEPTARTKAMKTDLAEMEYMIDEYLDFARGEGGEDLKRLPLMPLVEQVAENARRAGAEVTVEGDMAAPPITAPIRSRALYRALANLVANAASHGDHVRLAVRRGMHLAEILVDDDGPGIDPAHYEDAFKPFNRLDESRNQNAKGVGLGLAIARDVVRGHGGEVILDKSPMGGLRAIVRLPA
jgi:two-component system osmolarity sensor histidine kinase EnvZ